MFRKFYDLILQGDRLSFTLLLLDVWSPATLGDDAALFLRRVFFPDSPGTTEANPLADAVKRSFSGSSRMSRNHLKNFPLTKEWVSRIAP
jgi:hypothetical protein